MRFLRRDFYRNPSTKDGFRSVCKSCEKVKRTVGKPEAPAALGLHDTPYGLDYCKQCLRLVPLTRLGQLETHYRFVRNGETCYTAKLVKCENATVAIRVRMPSLPSVSMEGS